MKALGPNMSGSEKFAQLVNGCVGTLGEVTRLRQDTANEIAKAETKALHLQQRAEYHEGLIESDTGSGMRANTPTKSFQKYAKAAGEWKAYSAALREDLNTALATAKAEISLPPI